ncbi:MAG: hypothetical protein H6905_07470 [Hyphomicrobiales bacterium]|nr:hypothetical protein [Hyphomicrobiales bacterium]
MEDDPQTNEAGAAGETMTFVIEGEPSVTVTVTEMDGQLEFALTVNEADGAIGDLRGLFFHVADPNILEGLSVSGDDVTDSAFGADGISNLGNGCTMKGEADPFDAGIEIGSQGMSKDDIQSTSFTLAHDSLDLSLDMIMGQEFGIRMTSVGSEDDGREGSLKLVGTAEPSSDVNEAPVAVDDGLQLAYDINDDITGSVNVVANDYDPDNDNADLMVTEINGIAVAPGDEVEISWNAAAVLGEDGQTITYFYYGEGAPSGFTYTIADIEGLTDTGAVDVYPVEDYFM